MITVYVRHIDRNDGQLLGEFRPNQIKPLVEQFKAFPTVLDGNENCFYSAQFMSRENEGVYFEIIVTTPDKA